MCGIIGAIFTTKITEIILNGLKKLEYRGYDSSGLALYENKKCTLESRKHGFYGQTFIF